MKEKRLLSISLPVILPLILIVGLTKVWSGFASAGYADWTSSPLDNGLLVTFPGDFVSELGGTDWDPADTTTQASDDNGDQVWIFRTTAIPSGTWSFKATVGGTWDETYGAGGLPNGPAVTFTATEGITVSLYYDRRDNYVTSRPNARIPVIVGNFLSEIGGADWDAANLTGWLKDKDGDGVYTWLAHNVPGGRWYYKVALNESMAENYGAGGIPDGSNIVLNVPVGGADVLFEYNDSTHLATAQVLVYRLGFAPAVDFGETPDAVQAVAIGDLDHDGRLDVVSGDANGRIIAWQNDGTPFDGDWNGNLIETAVGAVEGIALADLDRDGDLDAVSVDRAGHLTIYENDGTPFEGKWSATREVGSHPLYSVVTADLDQDGWVDLVTGGDVAYPYELLGWRNTGRPFDAGEWSPTIIGQPSAIYALAAADIDYDGDVDLAVGGISQDISIWENDGTPFDGVVWAHNYIGSASDTIHALAINDVDRDGDLDIVSASETDADENAVQLWLNDLHDPGGDGKPFSGQWARREIGAESRFGYGVVMLDMDRDGDADIVATLDAGEGNLSGWANDENGAVWKAYPLDSGSQTLLTLAAGDLDNDGDADLVGSDAQRLLGWENLNLPSEWGNWTPYPSPDTGNAFAGLAAGDFNGDGWTDIAAARPDGKKIHLWRYDVISHWIELPASPLVLPNVVDIAVGQIMAGTGEENNQDLVAASDGYGLRAWFVSERGMVWDPANTGLPTSGKYTAVTLGDINRDGNLDIIAAGDGVRYYRNEGWSWAEGTAIATTDVFSAVVVADLNHDAYLDVMGAPESGGIPIWLGNGGTAWNLIDYIGGQYQFSALAVGDLNRDGNLDLAAASLDKGCMLWLGDGTGKMMAAQSPACPKGIRTIALNDYDLDGDLDWITAGFRGIYLYRQQADGSWMEASENLPQGPSNFREVLFAHIDHDGALDLLAAEDASGIYIWTAREPPPSFSNFQPGYPQRWVTTRTPLCSVEVTDIGSGLDVERGAWYQYSTDNGSTWSGWLNAIVTGTNVVSGTPGPVQLWATPTLTESYSTQSRNKIRFRMYDMAGNLGVSPDYSVWVDTVPPNNPVQIYSTDHSEGEWSNDTSFTFHWSSGTDEGSGVLGYYWVLTQSITNTETPHLMGYSHVHDVTLYTGEGTWYFYLATQDFAGNWSIQTRRGPYGIDTTPPDPPWLIWSSHEINAWSNTNVITVQLFSSDHGGSGVHGYSVDWSQNPSGWVDESIDFTSYQIVSDPLGDGWWYLHARAVDQADNASTIAHIGPFGVDVTPPSSCSIYSPAVVHTPSFGVSWYCQDTYSGIRGYDVQVRWHDEEDENWSNWQNWYTLTPEINGLYTGAEHLHTYQFRARAYDNAGNVTGWFTSGETLVQLPPSIASYSPASGFASAGRDAPPLQIVPGTAVVITGTAFAPTATVYFRGVPMEPTTSQVVSKTLIRAVIGADTPTGSGQMCVRTAFGEDCEPFEVTEQPFPMRWGLGFDNFNTPRGDMDWGVFEKAFGQCEVNFCPLTFLGIPIPCDWCPDEILVPRPLAYAFFEASRGIAEKGDCFGISTITLDFYYGNLSPDDFADHADIPASLSWETPRLADEIRARQWRQLSIESLAYFSLDIPLFEVLGPLGYLSSKLPILSPPQQNILCIEDDGRGHCVNPYDITLTDSEGAAISVYDNNFPYINNNYPEEESSCTRHDYLDAAFQRQVDVTATWWTYGTASCEPPTWDGGSLNDYFVLIPYVLLRGPHHLPTDLLGIDLIFGSNGAGHSRVEDDQGRMIGYDETGQFTQTMPITDAMRIIPFMDGDPPFEGYYLPRAGDYTVYISGTAHGTYSMALFGAGGTGLSLDNVPLGPASLDAVAFEQKTATGESGFAFTTGDTTKPITLTLVRQIDGTNEQRAFVLDNLAIGSGKPLSLTTASDADSLILAGGAGSAYDVCFQNIAPGQMPSEFCWSGIALTASDRHILTPQDWKHLNSTRVRLDIDRGNDGTVDETQWLEGHGLALSMHATPTVIRSGDLLTYTLSYTVTGSEIAPGTTLTATVPYSVTFLNATDGVTPVGNVLTWSLGDLSPGTSGYVTFTTQVNQVPEDTVIASLARLQDTSGRWAMATGASVGPAFGYNKIYLPLIMKQRGQ